MRDPREAFSKEQDLVAAFTSAMQMRGHKDWTLYHETAGFDVLAVHSAGYQIGVEAKLSLNLDVVLQALPHHEEMLGPDYRAVLVPSRHAFKPSKLRSLLPRLGLGVITVYNCRYDPEGVREPKWMLSGSLPEERTRYSFGADWWNWNPEKRCKLPDYVPDVIGGDSAPLALTPWKVKAIKLCVLMDRQGFVTRTDMKALGLSPSRWTDRFHGFLVPDGSGRYVRCSRTPDFRAQHPRNYVEIEADASKWGKDLGLQ